jgi:O-antigen ligase
LIWTFSPKLQDGFAKGLKEVNDAFLGNVKVESWNVRIQMITHSWNMMIEQPWVGWGIGSWNEQWAQRVPVEIAGFNMPHNDALWMGAEAGIVGAIGWLFLMLSGLWQTWKSRHWMGAAATAAICIATFASLVNNGTRDATIGLPMLWLMGLLISRTRTH